MSYGIPVDAGHRSKAEAAPSFEQILKIDVHSHIFDDMPEFVEMLRRINFRVVNICVYGNKPELLELAEQQAELIYRKYRPTFYFASTFDLTRRNEPGYAQQAIAWLDKSFEAGAIFAKIWKEVGMDLKTPAGAHMMPDDPLFDPIYSHLATIGKPLMAHFADPLEAWLPLDPNGVNYGYYSDSPEWHVYGREGFPSHAQILAAGDRILEKHPKLIMIGAHLASMDHDLDALAKRLDRHPNLHVDVSARTTALFRQPVETVRNFFVTYQDRILYGVDVGEYTPGGSPSMEQRVAFTENMERCYRTDYQFYAARGKHIIGGREVESPALPYTVLKKIYHGNAQRLMPVLAG